MKRWFLWILISLALAVLISGCGFGRMSYAGKHLVFETTDTEGNAVSSEELFAQHEITMLNFWATWCGPCVTELPYLNLVNEELAKMDGAVVGMINDGNGKADLETAKQHLKESSAAYLNILAPSNFREMITQTAYPMTVFVNRDGVVIGKTLIGTTVSRAIVDYYVSAAREALESK